MMPPAQNASAPTRVGPRVFASSRWMRCLTPRTARPVFASLDASQRAALVALRSQNNGATLAAMLEATSLACQPDLRAALHALPFQFIIYTVNSTVNFARWRRKSPATVTPFLPPGTTHTGRIPRVLPLSPARILRLEIKDTL